MNQKASKKAESDAEIPAPDWHPADIKSALNKVGKTLAMVAEDHNLNSGSSLSKALTSSSPVAERRIADALGLHPKVIWPSRYEADGTHKPQGSHALRRKVPTQAPVIKEERA
jgi:lambda repressor-like predicted transcriptional regulator